MAMLKITLVKSINKSTDRQVANVKALGLHKLGSSVIQKDTPAIRGMITKVNHLLSVEETGEVQE